MEEFSQRKINYFLNNAPPKSDEKLSEMLTQVNIFVKHVEEAFVDKKDTRLTNFKFIRSALNIPGLEIPKMILTILTKA